MSVRWPPFASGCDASWKIQRLARAANRSSPCRKEDRYAHGSAQHPVRHHGREPVPLLDLVEDGDDPVALVDLPSGRIEEEHHAF